MPRTDDINFSELQPGVQGSLLNRTRGDKVIWAVVVLLALVSMLVVYSSTGLLAYRYNRGNTEVYLFRQVLFIVTGLAVIYFFSPR
jgi:hypothetical protein